MVTRRSRFNNSQHDFAAGSSSQDRVPSIGVGAPARGQSSSASTGAPARGRTVPANGGAAVRSSASGRSAAGASRANRPVANGGGRTARPNVATRRPSSITAIAPRQSADVAQYSRHGGNYGNGANGGDGNGKKRKSIKEPKKRMSKGTKISIIVLLVLLAVLIGGVIGFYKFISSVNNELAGGKSEEELLAIQDSLVARVRTSGENRWLIAVDQARPWRAVRVWRVGWTSESRCFG